jgi:hypothetical protein
MVNRIIAEAAAGIIRIYLHLCPTSTKCRPDYSNMNATEKKESQGGA